MSNAPRGPQGPATLPRPVSGPVRATPARLPRPGGNASLGITHRDEQVTSRVTEIAVVGEEGPGIVGVSQGLTIPGPKGSYAAARVDVSVYMPCGADKASVERVLASCKEVVDDHLDRMAEEVRVFFSQ